MLQSPAAASRGHSWSLTGSPPQPGVHLVQIRDPEGPLSRASGSTRGPLCASPSSLDPPQLGSCVVTILNLSIRLSGAGSKHEGG